jgi:chromosome segregation protein
MKLKKLEIFGFKSFPEKASISFPPGVAAVVGPNGCGKSNIVDALRWVMGEQSIKQLRGKDKGDIIFAGTNGKAPVNMAEVSLTLVNDNGSGPEELRDFSEINITRRLYRSGESSYLINKQPCRLKDVHNVFLGSGMGARSYAVIGQGNIGAITDADPDQRRYFVEEAAGVTRYKNRKVEALRKVDATKQNLYRVNDIIKEVFRQMGGLKRQAKKAELFKKYQAAMLDLDVRLTAHNFEALSTEISEAETLLQNLKDSDIAHTAEIKKLDAAVEDIKLKRWQKNQAISEQKNRQFENQRRIDKAENDLTHLKDDIHRLAQEIQQLESARVGLNDKNEGILTEISQAEGEIVETQGQIEAVRGEVQREEQVAQEVGRQLANLNQTLEARKKELMDLSAKEAQYQNVYQHAANTKESLKRRLRQADEQEVMARRKVETLLRQETEAKEVLEDFKGRIQETTEQVAGTETRLQETRKELGDQVKLFHTLELDRKTYRSRYATLKKMEESFEWYRDGVKAIMRSHEEGEAADCGVTPPARETILGLMADILEPKPGYEASVEAVLGESLQYVLVQDQDAGAAAISYLQASGAGRSGFVPMENVKRACGVSESQVDADRKLLNFVTVKDGFEKAAQALLDHVAVAEDMPQALEISRRNGRFQAIVTKQGDVISPQGVMIGGSKDKLSGILQKKSELKELKEKIADLDVEIDAAGKRQTELEGALRDVETLLQQLIEKRNRLTRDEMEAEKALYKVSEDLKHARQHLEVVQLEQEQLLGEKSDVDAEMDKFKLALAQIEGDIKQKQTEVVNATGQIETIQMDVEDYRQKVVDLKLKQSALVATLENRQASIRRLKDFQKDAIDRLQQLSTDIDAKSGRRVASQEKVALYEEQLSQLYDVTKALTKTLESNEEEYNEISSKLKHTDDAISSIQGLREKTLQKIRLVEVELSQKQMKRENMISRIEERHQQNFETLRREYLEAPRQAEGEGEGDGDASPSPFADMAPDQLTVELERYRTKVQRIGDVNLSAIKEYEELSERHEFLTEQRDDLNQAVEDLHKVIRKINRITQELFISTFNEINDKLKEVFPRLFSGGSAELVLTEPDKPLESGVEFMIHPPGKKLTRLSLLSGGEKALSAIAFIFSIFLMKPASFCLMDEIDAPLDDANVTRFNELLRFIGEKSQIVMITHNKQSMEFADVLFGITMERKGVSKVVSVNLERQAA